MTRQMTGAKMIVQALRDQGVDTVFGYPGGAIMPVYDALYDNKMLTIIYLAPNKDESTRSIHPLALIYRGTNTELIAVNDAIRNHPIEAVGKRLRSAMTAMKEIKTEEVSRATQEALV